MQAGFNDVFHVAQSECVALGAVIIGQQRLGIPQREAGLHLIAPEGKKADWFLDGNAADSPTELRLVENGFQQTACGAGRDDGITDPLNFHLRTSETGKIAPSS